MTMMTGEVVAMIESFHLLEIFDNCIRLIVVENDYWMNTNVEILPTEKLDAY